MINAFISLNLGLSYIAGYLLKRFSNSVLLSLDLGFKYAFASAVMKVFNFNLGYSLLSSKCLCISTYLSEFDSETS